MLAICTTPCLTGVTIRTELRRSCTAVLASSIRWNLGECPLPSLGQSVYFWSLSLFTLAVEERNAPLATGNIKSRNCLNRDHTWYVSCDERLSTRLHLEIERGVDYNYCLQARSCTYRGLVQIGSAKGGPLGLQVCVRLTGRTAVMAPKPEPLAGGSSGEREREEIPQRQQQERGRRDDQQQAQPPPEPMLEERNHESMLEQRLNRLIEQLNSQRHNSHLKNIAFEIGRPSLEPVPEMRRNPANPYGRFSIDELFKMRVYPVSNNMANSEQMAKIASAISGLGVPTEQVATVILKTVIMCASVSSSAFLDPDGSIEFEGGAVPTDAVIAIMKEVGLRKVCRLYAPVVWNSMLVRNQPPSDWQAMGYPYNARFAAFDTFDYVTNTAAIQPVEGLIRRPTAEECIAHNAHKRLALDRSNRNERFGNLETEYTGGLQGPEITRNHRNANNA